MSQANQVSNSLKPFLILSLDGGGVRGIISLIMLREIEKRTGKPIAKLFDLIVGSSSGGIIGLGLSTPKDKNYLQPKYRAKDLLDLYIQSTPKIFSKSVFKSLVTGLGLWAPRYSRSSLDDFLYQVFGSTPMSWAITDVIVTSYSITKDSPSIWSNYKAKSDPTLDISMSDAAGASSAAPTYFAPKVLTINGIETSEVDGGIYANNPETIGVAEALIKDRSLIPEQIFILSLGTGSPKLGQILNNKGVLGWLTEINLIDLMLNSDSQLAELELQPVTLLNRYRLQLDLASKFCSMDNASDSNLQELVALGENFAKKSDSELTTICNFLSQVNK